MDKFGEIAPNARRTEEQLRCYGYLGVERRRRPSVVSWRALACVLGVVLVAVVLAFSFFGRG